MKLSKTQLKKLIKEQISLPDLVRQKMGLKPRRKQPSASSIADQNAKIRLESLNEIIHLLTQSSDLLQDAFEEETIWRKLESRINSVLEVAIRAQNKLETDPMKKTMIMRNK